jgi:hypothetical protein
MMESRAQRSIGNLLGPALVIIFSSQVSPKVFLIAAAGDLHACICFEAKDRSIVRKCSKELTTSPEHDIRRVG